MSLLLNHPCMNHDDFLAYKDELDAVKAGDTYQQTHTGEKEHWTWPALIVTLVEFSRDRNGLSIMFDHTSVSQTRLLKVLGLSKEEIKVEFEPRAIDMVPEISETREV